VWVNSFVNWYNDEHLHSAIRFVTPNMRHGGKDLDALANCAILYANARGQKPQRWLGKTHNWQPPGAVWLNPERNIIVVTQPGLLWRMGGGLSHGVWAKGAKPPIRRKASFGQETC
jgi:hypothetical protein